MEWTPGTHGSAEVGGGMDQMRQALLTENKEFELSEMLERVIRANQHHTVGGRRHLSLVRGPEVPSHVSGSPWALEEALNCLVRFLLRGSDGSTLELKTQVEDRAPGLVRIRFDLVSVGVVSNALATESDGSSDFGVARDLVQSMGSDVAGPYQSGRGLTVRFSLPFSDKDGRPAQLEPCEPPLRRRILLVEDNRVTQLATQKLLERRGHSVETAGDGLEAIEKVVSYRTLPRKREKARD